MARGIPTQIATISTNNDEKLGKLIGDAFREVGETGVVTMEPTEGGATEIEIVPEEIVETTPEYDSGDVDVSALLEDDMESNYNLNTVEDFEVEDMLSGAKIVGDLPEEVDFE